MIIITRKEQESPRGQLRGNNITCAKRLFLTKRQVCAQQYGTVVIDIHVLIVSIPVMM